MKLPQNLTCPTCRERPGQPCRRVWRYGRRLPQGTGHRMATLHASRRLAADNLRRWEDQRATTGSWAGRIP